MAPAQAVEPGEAVYLPNITKTLGGQTGWTTPVDIQNIGSASTSATISLFRFGDGALAAQFTTPVLGSAQSWTFDPLAFPTLPGDSQYAAIVRPASGQVAAVVRQASGSTAMAYAGASTGAATVFLPNITRALGGPNGWQTPFIVQNLDAAPATVTVSFYRFSDGLLAHEIQGLSIAAGRSASVLPWAITGLRDGEQYGVVVRGAVGAKLYAVVNEHAGLQAMSYEGLSSGARVLYLPNVVKYLGGTDGWSSPFVIQNMGTTTAGFSLAFFSFVDGALVRRIGGLSLAPGRSQAVDVRSTPSDLPVGQYSVVVEGEAGASLGAIVNQMHLVAEMSMSYDALSIGTPVAYVPYVQNRVGTAAWISTIVAQNISAATADLTVTLFDPAGRAVAQQEYLRVRPGAAAVYDPRSDPTLAVGTYSATVHSTGAVAAIVNHTGSGGDSAMSFTSTPGVLSTAQRVLALPRGLTFDMGAGTSEADTVDLRPGFARASLYLKSHVGGDRARTIVTRVRSESSAYCCQGGGTTAGSGSMYFNVAHEHWQPPRSFPIAIDRQKTAAHEYVHTWQGDVGCLAAPTWFTEGMAEYIAYETLIRDASLTDAEVQTFHSHIKRAPLQATLSDLERAFPSDAYPYSVGYLAVRLLVSGRTPLSLRAFCERLARAQPWRDAFQISFGISVDAFYAQFAAYRQGL